MKLKAWHIGCLVVLVLAALYFLVGTREGLANPTCWEDVLDASSGRFLNFTHELNTIMDGPTIFDTLDEAKTACQSDTMCKGVVGGEKFVTSPPTEANPKPSPVLTLKYAKFYGDETIDIVRMSPLPYPNKHTYYRKKPCTDSSSSSSPPPGMTGTAPMPPGPTGTAGGASMTPVVPTPSTTTPGGPTYNFMCSASPVSGMTGSVGMPETPPIWNVNQPPPGHNSKHGYTLY